MDSQVRRPYLIKQTVCAILPLQQFQYEHHLHGTCTAIMAMPEIQYDFLTLQIAVSFLFGFLLRIANQELSSKSVASYPSLLSRYTLSIYKQLLLRFANILKIKHPNLLPFYELKIFSGFCYFLTEWTPTNLAEFCAQQNDLETFVYKWAGDLARAMTFLHQRGCYDFDVRPENCFLFRKGTLLKLCHMNKAVRSPRNGFIPSELCKHRASVASESTSIYSFGKLMEYLSDISSKGSRVHSSGSSILVQIAKACTRSSRRKRPKMETVLKFILYHRPELTFHKIDGPVKL